MSDQHDKKIFLGLIVFVIGLAWYAQETRLIELEPFWPIMVMFVGFLLVIKGAIYKQWEFRSKKKK